jgi:Tfp pilus assembly protein PilN
MKRQVAWVLRGSTRTQAAFDEQSEAIRALQRQIAELESTVARIDGRSQEPTDRLAEIGNQVEMLKSRLDQIDDTVTALVRVVAPPTPD